MLNPTPVPETGCAAQPTRIAEPVPASAAAAAAAAPSCPRIGSGALLRGGRELEIVHGDAVYRLRLTAMGKLILTK